MAHVKLDPVSGPFIAGVVTCYATYRLCMMIQILYDAAADDDDDGDDDVAMMMVMVMVMVMDESNYHNWTAIQIAVAPMPTRRALSGMRPWLCCIQGGASDGCMQVHVEVKVRRSKNDGRVKKSMRVSIFSGVGWWTRVSLATSFLYATRPISFPNTRL